MATWEDAGLLGKGPVQSRGEMFSMWSDMPSNNRTSSAPQITPCLLSPLTSGLYSQHAKELGRLQQELKQVQKDMNNFQQNILETLKKLEGRLNYLTNIVCGLESRSHDMEQRLRAEEDRGIARSKVLGFLLPREKELRAKCMFFEKLLLKKKTRGKELIKNTGFSNKGATSPRVSWD